MIEQETFLPSGPKMNDTGQFVNGEGENIDIPSSALPNSGVVAGSYSNTDLTVNSKGIITAASNGTGGGSGLLAYTSYNPNTLTDFSTTSTTGEDLDATNLSITFTVPASGKVLISLNATCFHSTSGVGLMFLLRTTGGSNVAGTKRQVTAASATTGQQLPACSRFVITGLTPSASITYRWGVMTTGAGTCHVRYGDDGNATGQEYGPAVMEVWAAP